MMNTEQTVMSLKALAQSTRLAVFRLLMKRGTNGLPAGAIAEQLQIPQNTLSAHLNILSNAGLIAADRQGRKLIYSVQIGAIRQFIGYLVNDCCDGHPDICAITVNTCEE